MRSLGKYLDETPEHGTDTDDEELYGDYGGDVSDDGAAAGDVANDGRVVHDGNTAASTLHSNSPDRDGYDPNDHVMEPHSPPFEQLELFENPVVESVEKQTTNNTQEETQQVAQTAGSIADLGQSDQGCDEIWYCKKNCASSVAHTLRKIHFTPQQQQKKQDKTKKPTCRDCVTTAEFTAAQKEPGGDVGQILKCQGMWFGIACSKMTSNLLKWDDFSLDVCA